MTSEVADVYCPFPYRENPEAAEARAHVARWVSQTGLVRRESARRRFELADFGWFAALVYPTADRAGLDLVTDWFAWLFLVDDQFDDGLVGRSQHAAEHAVGRLRAVLTGPDTGNSSSATGREAGGTGEPVPPAVSALADLWRRTVAGATSAWRRRFAGHLEECLTTAAVWEAGNRARGVVPDESTYVEKRRHTGAIYVCMDLIEIVEQLDVADERYASVEFTDALEAACNVVCWTNDVYSLDKERALGEVHNLAYLLQHHRGLHREQALAEVCRLVSAETRRFLAAELAVLRVHGPALAPYLAGMRTWMRGNLDWSRRTKRYHALATAPPADYIEGRVLSEGT